MKKPQDYELKKWLSENILIGLELNYYQTGTDTSDTDWIIKSKNNGERTVRSGKVEQLVTVRVDWVRVIRATDAVQNEVKEWDAFSEKEAKDIEEYERLKEKLGF